MLIVNKQVLSAVHIRLREITAIETFEGKDAETVAHALYQADSNNSGMLRFSIDNHMHFYPLANIIYAQLIWEDTHE